MEPITVLTAISTYVIGKTLLDENDTVLSFTIKSAVGGWIEGRAEDLWEFSRQRFQDWRRVLAAPENTPVLKAVRKSYLEAAIILCDARLVEITGVDKQQRKEIADEKRFIESLQSDFRKELAELKKPNYIPPFLEAITETSTLMPLGGKSADEKSDELRKKVKAELLKELRSILSRLVTPSGRRGSILGLQDVKLPARLEEMISYGWKDAETSSQRSIVDWFDLVCLFFAEEITHNPAVRAFFQSGLLIKIKDQIKNTETGLTTAIQAHADQILTRIKEMEKSIVLRLHNLGIQLRDLPYQTQDIKTIQRAGFEALENKLNPIEKNLLRVAANTETTIREIRRTPLYEGLAKDEIAMRVDEIRKIYTSLFVWREDYFKQIDDFIAHNKSGMITITAPAGFGKSALLANWVEQRRGRGCFIAYHFFSVRDDMIRTLTGCLYNLLRQVYVYHGESYEQLPVDEYSLKLALASIVRQRGAHNGEPLVIAIDGLDEADKEFSPLFSSPLPNGVHVVALWRAGLEANSIYLQDWKDNSTHLTLARLPKEAIPEWLRETGSKQLIQLADDDTFVTRLDEETKGFPLYLSFLVEDLIEAAEKGSDPRQLINWTPKGLGGYVRRQLKFFGQQDRDVELMFALLSVAAGPLSRTELQRLTGLTTIKINNLPRNLARWFTILEQQGEVNYSFAHPLLADEFERELGDDAYRALDCLMQDCARWKENYARWGRRGSQYALLHYAENLHGEKRWDDLFALARDESYKKAQSEAFPESPDLPLKILQTSIFSAADKEDAAAIAEFMFAHGQRVVEITSESPLEVLRRGQLERAWLLADQHDLERRALWLLLLAWELGDKEKLGERHATLDRLISVELPRLLNQTSVQAAYFIYKIFKSGNDIFRKLVIDLLDDGGRKELCQLLVSEQRFRESLETFDCIKDLKYQAEAMREIVKAWVEAQQSEEARRNFDQAVRAVGETRYIGYIAAVMVKMAKAQVEAGMNGEAERSFDQAMKAAGEIGDVYDKAAAMVEIAKAQLEAGLTEEARRSFDQAMKAAGEVGEADYKELTIVEIAKAQAELRHFDQAMRTAGGIDDVYDKAAVMVEIAKGQAKAGMNEEARKSFDQAMRIAEDIFLFKKEVAVMLEIAKAQAEAGLVEEAQMGFDQAMKAAAEINNARQRTVAIVEIAKAQAEAGEFDQALRIAGKINDARQRTATMVEIAKAQAKAGMSEEARRIFDQVMGNVGMIHYADAVAMLVEIAKAQAKAGMNEKAGRTFDQAMEACASSIYDVDDKSAVMVKVAKAQAEAGLVEEAQMSFDQAMKAAAEMSYYEYKLSAMIHIAKAQVEVGLTEEARRSFDQAMRYAGEIHYFGRKAVAMMKVAKAQVEVGLTGEAQISFDQAMRYAGEVDDVDYEELTIVEIAKAEAELGEVEQAMRTAGEIYDIYRKSTVMVKIAKAQAEAQEFDEAMCTIDEIDDARQKAEALREIAKGQAKAGMNKEARGSFEQAMGVVGKINDARQRTVAIVEIAKAQAEAGEFDQALRTAAEIYEARYKVAVIVEIAKGQLEVGQGEGARRSFDQAMKAADEILFFEYKVAAMVEIAKARLEAGLTEEARRSFDQAMKAADEILFFEYKAAVVVEIAKAEAELGDFNQAMRNAGEVDYTDKSRQ